MARQQTQKPQAQLLPWAHPLVNDWFQAKFGTPTEPQEQGWPNILAGRTTLISAPTGSGKTLAAFLACIDGLVRKAVKGTLKEQTYLLYVSPLKALSNDIQKNLAGPLDEIYSLAAERSIEMAQIRTAVRTGDTLPAERRAMLKKPPHILVTTPESLYILLTSDKSRDFLKNVETVIIDEIHAVADDKRGAHLSLTLERLEQLTEKPPNRIGLSATQKPIEIVGQFLAGSNRPDPVIVNVGHKRQLDLAIEVPSMPLGPVASNEMWDEIYDKVSNYTNTHRSILIFVNTRKMCERMAMNLGQRLGEDSVAAHHGSLSRKIRLAAENKLKNGEIKVLVATASLELGIDIGFVDLVCVISSPRSIATALQRIGRAGHWRGAIPKGRLFATTRDEMMELAALVQAINHGDLDRLMIPECPLDVLAQQIVAMCAVEQWTEDKLFKVVKGAYPFRNLTRDDFDDIVQMLSDGIAARRGRYGAHLFRDKVNGVLKGRRGAKLVAVTNGGAIVDRGMYSVVVEPDHVTVGTLDEDFAVESNRGDIILLGNTSWRVKRVEAVGRVLVEDAHGASPTVPFWLGEAPARTAELSQYVSGLRESISAYVTALPAQGVFQSNPEVAKCVAWLKSECGLDDTGAEQCIEYVIESRAVLGTVPSHTTVVAERFFDEGGGMQLIVHSPFGARVNKAWGLALRKRFCRSFDFELQAAATDNGISIALSDRHSFPLADVFSFVTESDLREVLEQATLPSPIFATRFRWDATRALALLRFSGGKKVPPLLQRLRNEDLLAAVFPSAVACQDNVQGDIEIPEHPLVKEVMKDVLTEALDIDGLRQILRGIESGAIRCVAVDTPVPSQFSHEILNSNPYSYLDDAPLEERRARAVQMRRVLPQSVLEEVGLLDPAAINTVVEEAWPDVRDADELQDVLQTLCALPIHGVRAGLEQRMGIQWVEFFDQLAALGRATVARVNEALYWVPAERVRTFKNIFPSARFDVDLKDVEREPETPEAALQLMVRGWTTVVGRTTGNDLASRLGLSPRDTFLALMMLESDGSILRGKFRNAGEPATDEEIEWCDRRLLARIHRLTVGTLRKQIEPVTPADYMRWLLHWQHVAPSTQLAGERGMLEILKQLQGFEVPANAWERQVLARRLSRYNAESLDKLCMTGQVGWGRLSPHPATLVENNRDGDVQKTRRIIPTSVAPITFFVREESDWMMPKHPETESEETRLLSYSARQVREFLKARGASFFADIVRGTNQLKTEVETALWELVAAGVVTADGFDNLRALIDPKRRSGTASSRYARPRHSTGRWSLLYTDGVDRDRTIESACWMLLRRYGIVFRDVLMRETSLPRWRDLLDKFRRLEDRGDVRGGRFVSGFLGEQFALPDAVDSVRAMRKRELTGEITTVSAADPLNLVGIILPGERVPANSSRIITYKDGIQVVDEKLAAS